MSKAKDDEKSKKQKAIIILLIIIILILLFVIFFLFFKKPKEEKKPERNVIVNQDNAEDLASRLVEEEKTPMGSYEAKMNSTWNFENGNVASSNAYVENVINNACSVYFDLKRRDNDEIILASPIIPAGSYMKDITLDTALPKGTYQCVCTYYLLDEENEPFSKVNMGVTVNILG